MVLRELPRRQRDGTFTGEELTVRHWGLNPDERTRVQAQRNAAVDVMNSDGYLSVASGRWKARLSCYYTSPSASSHVQPPSSAP